MALKLSVTSTESFQYGTRFAACPCKARRSTIPNFNHFNSASDGAIQSIMQVKAKATSLQPVAEMTIQSVLNDDQMRE